MHLSTARKQRNHAAPTAAAGCCAATTCSRACLLATLCCSQFVTKYLAFAR